MENYPFVSIIVPVYNAHRTIVDCLESIQKLDYPKDKIEIIVVDNGSNDKSDEIAKTFGIKVLFETSMNSSYAARNKGIKAAHGELFAFTDADCVVSPWWLNFLVKDWNDQSVGCFCGEIEAFQPNTLIEKFSERRKILSQQNTLKNAYLPYAQTANVAYRREVFEQVGFFNPEMKSGGDADFGWRMQKETSFLVRFCPNAIVYHKHRTTIRALFKQYQKYEYGKKFWVKRYPDYPMPSAGMRFLALIGSLGMAFLLLPVNSIKLCLRRIDFTDFFSPFLVCVIAAGTLSARIGWKSLRRDLI